MIRANLFGRALLAIAAITLANCGGNDASTVDPNNAEQVMGNLVVKVGGATAAQITGSPPTQSTTTAAPHVDAGTSIVTTTTSANSTVSIPVSFQGSSAMASIFAKVTGQTNSYFEVDNPPGGKAAKAVPISGNGQSFVLTLTLTNDFNPGQFCIDITGRDQQVPPFSTDNVATVCVHLVSSITQTAEDQPAKLDLLDDLGGTWLSNCQIFRSASASGSGKIGYTFTSATSSYIEFLQSWSNTTCQGNPSASGNVGSGSLQIGDAPTFLPQTGTWATAVDFIPDSPSQQLKEETCFNVLRFESGNPDQFFLGIPVGFTIQNQADVPGSCVSAANRPTFLSSDVVFTSGAAAPVNATPVANAGPDQSVKLNTATVTLDGSASNDSDGTIASYAWQQISGTPTVTLTGASTATPTFHAPNAAATLTFRLTVTDNSGASAQDTVVVNVVANQAPIANAGPDKVVPSATVGVTLVGTGSSDPDGTIASYQWSETSGVPVSINNATSPTATFTAPTVVSGSAVLVFQLQVTDNTGGTATDTVTITVVKDVAPVANAGPDQSVPHLATVTLDGTGSTDSDGTVAGYAWTQTNGPAVTLSSATASKPTFTAPEVTSGSAVLTFQLIVTDNLGLQSAADTVNITVNANQPPVANAGPDIGALSQQQNVVLDGSGSHDTDGTIATYSWSQIAGPGVTLIGASTATPNFDMPSVNTGQKLTFRLTVTDNNGAVAQDTVVVTAVDPLAFTYSTTKNAAASLANDANNTGFFKNADAFAFVLKTNQQPVGNWFVNQSSADPNPQSEVFGDIIAGNGECTGGPQGTAVVTCDDKFVTHYLGTTIGSCAVAADKTVTFATLSADTQTLTFNVACVGTTVTSGDDVGIGLNGGSGTFGTPHSQARSAIGSGSLAPVTGTCTAGSGSAACGP